MKAQSSSPPYDGTAEEKYRYAQYLRYDENVRKKLSCGTTLRSSLVTLKPPIS